jgi:hypothetical protein
MATIQVVDRSPSTKHDPGPHAVAADPAVVAAADVTTIEAMHASLVSRAGSGTLIPVCLGQSASDRPSLFQNVS